MSPFPVPPALREAALLILGLPVSKAPFTDDLSGEDLLIAPQCALPDSSPGGLWLS